MPPRADPPLPEGFLRPQWAAPAGVHACMSTRRGGVSGGPWSSFNLGVAVGDDPAAVAQNRQRFEAALDGARPVWLRQVHGTQVLRLVATTPTHPEGDFDAAWTTQAGIACVVGAADCMPVLFATRDGRAVAAAHAGWRGLAGGVLEATLEAMRAGAGVRPDEVVAWLGPAIGPQAFEVGAEVLRAFGLPEALADVPADVLAGVPAGVPAARFAPRADGSPRWRLDLGRLARQRLERCGVGTVAAADACTFSQPQEFFSHRRDGTSGRMAAAIWRAPSS